MKPRLTANVLLGIQQLALPMMGEYLRNRMTMGKLMDYNTNCTPGYLEEAAKNCRKALAWADGMVAHRSPPRVHFFEGSWQVIWRGETLYDKGESKEAAEKFLRWWKQENRIR